MIEMEVKGKISEENGISITDLKHENKFSHEITRLSYQIAPEKHIVIETPEYKIKIYGVMAKVSAISFMEKLKFKLKRVARMINWKRSCGKVLFILPVVTLMYLMVCPKGGESIGGHLIYIVTILVMLIGLDLILENKNSK